jgi:hypothetical protein
VDLGLDQNELVLTRASLAENLINVAVCGLSITLAYLTESGWLPGVIYFLLGPLQALNGWWFSRQLRAGAKPA